MDHRAETSQRVEAWRILSSSLPRTDLAQGSDIGWVDEKPARTITLQWADRIFWGEQQPDAGYVHKLAVRPAYAGQKIGLEMLRWAEDTTRKTGEMLLRLNCLAEDRKIRDYYEHAGFLYKGNVAGPKPMATLYEKAL